MVASSSSDRPVIVACVAIVVALAIPMFFIGLGSWALADPDEPYYAVPAAEMLQTGTWQVPVFRGQPWFDKPILFYWLVLANYRILGVSETSARLWSALAGLLGLVAVLAFGRRIGLCGWDALVAPIVLATSLGYALAARAAVTDMTLTLLITAGMLATARRLAGGGVGWAVLAGVAFGLAALTKGPVAVLVPAMALCGYGLLTGRRDIASVPSLAAGAAGFVVAAGPWYVYMAVAYPDLLVTTFLQEGNLGRFLRPEHATFPFYYFVILAAALLPWSSALPAALARAARAGSRAREGSAGQQPRELFLLCWFGSVILIFSLAASKLPSYILPALPPAALLLAAYWQTRLARPRPRRPAALWSAVGGVALATAAAAAAVWSVEDHGWQVALTPALVAGGLVVAGSLLAVLAVARGSLQSLLVAQGATSAATMLVILAAALPALEPYHSTAPLVRQLRDACLTDEVVGAYRVSDVSLDFYLGRNPARAGRIRDLLAMARLNPGGIWVVRTQDVETLLADRRVLAELVQRGPNRSAMRMSEREPHASSTVGQ